MIIDWKKILQLPVQRRIQILKGLLKELTGEDRDAAEEYLNRAETELQRLQEERGEELVEKKKKIEKKNELEEIVEQVRDERQEQERIRTREEQQAYVEYLKNKPMDDVYGRVNSLYKELKSENRDPTLQEKQRLEAFHQALYEKEKSSGEYHFSNREARERTAADNMLDELLGKKKRDHYQ